MPEVDITVEIEERIATFKGALQNGVEAALNDHILRHDCSIVGAEIEQGIRACIAAEFGGVVDDIYVVGSAKLGFSPKPGQYFKHFSDQSDIDVALISSTLYAEIWHEVHQMDRVGEFYSREKFSHYHLMGWIRPDALPAKAEYARCHSWWNFFKQLSSKEDFFRMKIRGGLYFDTQFLRHYQLNGLTAMREHVLNGKA